LSSGRGGGHETSETELKRQLIYRKEVFLGSRGGGGGGILRRGLRVHQGGGGGGEKGVLHNVADAGAEGICLEARKI